MSDRVSGFLFWSDRWLSDSPLAVWLHFLFNHARNKNAVVQECFEMVGGQASWDLGLNRRLSMAAGETVRESHLHLTRNEHLGG